MLSVLFLSTEYRVLSTEYCSYATFCPTMPEAPAPEPQPLYCPKCGCEVTDPLICGDCSAVICRNCGTPLESPDELGIG